MNEIDVNVAGNLNPLETQVLELIDGIRQKRAPNTVVRVVGGWVRDKLLGLKSDDIDIAIDMPGYEFAQIVAQAAVKYGLTQDPKAYKVSLEKSADPNEVEPSDDLMVGAVNLLGQKIETMLIISR